MSDPDTVTINVADLDALIERKIAERDAEAAKPKMGRTPDCNCRAEGYLERTFHQFGCPYGAKSAAARKAWLKGEVEEGS